MSAQPEALRLAGILDGDYCPDWFYETGVDEVVAELRRLHAENEALQQKLRSTEATLQRGREVWKASTEAWNSDLIERDALLKQALEALESDDWQKKLMAAIDIRNHTSPKGATQ